MLCCETGNNCLAQINSIEPKIKLFVTYYDHIKIVHYYVLCNLAYESSKCLAQID